PPPLTQATKPTEATIKLYGSMCQACHGVDGKSPMKEMAFAGREWKHGTKTADMIKIITNGVPGTVMMPFKGRLTEAQIRDLARYVRALDKKLPPEKKK
ncbi:MAG: cytochrome c, partial [Acidobacteriota bacterium]|nr:cytochrome c [Acidobacteriota bacterium]